MTGLRLSHYSIASELGRGWMGVVFLAAMAALVLSACTAPPAAPPMLPQYPSPMEESVRSHDRIADRGVEADTARVPGLPDGSVRFVKRSGSGTLIHFHGAGFVPFETGGPAIIAAVNLGSGSSTYESPFSNEQAFEDLLEALGAEPPVTVSSWSAGYGAVRAILPTHGDRIDRLILLDGLHTDYVPARTTLHEGGTLNSAKLDPFLEFARQAADGGKKMLITHSEVFPGTYASTTETATHLAAELDLTKEAVLEWGPIGMQLLSRVEAGGLSILGFAGNTAPDHVDHLHALPFLYR